MSSEREAVKAEIRAGIRSQQTDPPAAPQAPEKGLSEIERRIVARRKASRPPEDARP